MDQYKVRDWMTTNPVTITPQTSLAEAHRLMKQKRVRRLPVLENGKLVGIVALSDVLEAEPSSATTLSIYEINYLLAEMKVEKIMKRNVITVTPDTPIREAANLMLTHKIGGLPVVEDGKLVGIITESDIFRMIVRTM
ncbi:MAG: CBS domain-containing protein [Thermoflexales bacterium]|nr:CBS domain-containing protein [Thermoflexales bacterium]MCS7324004.1 CBS domain-containing protein [Thermoflexales bacterium]MCX7937928.1 CBS domain-containing protein [Thermoflexales bacterium]MDW8052944.1 CBS domain-containing protein [Anaerolineae bacterium]MDW8291595.1 CBS domain-containing protein [Anaerolineae bacterium]